MTGFSLSGFTANMPTPKAYFTQIVGYIPNTIDRIVKRLNEPIVQKMAWIVLISWFLFKLLDRD